MQYHPYIAFLCIALSSINLHANSSDTTKSDTTYFLTFQEPEFTKLNYKFKNPVESQQIHRYQIEHQNFPYFQLSNPGHALYSPVFSGELNTDPFSDMYNGVYPYLSQNDELNYIRTNPPYTSLMYISGPKKEEFIDVLHTRNFGEHLNLAFNLSRQGSNGFFNNLKTRGSQFNATINFQTPNHRYTVLGNYLYHKRDLGENGGYQNFIDIENPETEGSSLLSYGSTSIRRESFKLSQSFGFGNKATEDDQHVSPWLSIEYNTDLETGYRYYRDLGNDLNYGGLNIDYYPNVFFDSTQTRDSLTMLIFKNQASVYLFPGKFKFGVSYRNEFVDYNQLHYIDTIYQNNFVGASFEMPLSKNFALQFQGLSAINGYREGDMEAFARLLRQRPDTGKLFNFGIEGFLQVLEPHFTLQRYHSNNFQWNNSLSKSVSSGLRFNLYYRGYRLGAEIGNLSNYIYYNEEALPEQHSPEVQYGKVHAGKLLNWRNLYLDNKIIYQYFSNRNVIPMPEFMVYESIYYRNAFFKEVLEYKVGFDVFYYTNHSGYAYMTALNQWHIQEDEPTGSYPYIDLFINFTLKQAHFFFKFQHFNKGMTGDGYFQVPGYPVPPRSFKFGIRWSLYD